MSKKLKSLLENSKEIVSKPKNDMSVEKKNKNFNANRKLVTSKKSLLENLVSLIDGQNSGTGNYLTKKEQEKSVRIFEKMPAKKNKLKILNQIRFKKDDALYQKLLKYHHKYTTKPLNYEKRQNYYSMLKKLNHKKKKNLEKMLNTIKNNISSIKSSNLNHNTSWLNWNKKDRRNLQKNLKRFNDRSKVPSSYHFRERNLLQTDEAVKRPVIEKSELGDSETNSDTNSDLGDDEIFNTNSINQFQTKNTLEGVFKIKNLNLKQPEFNYDYLNGILNPIMIPKIIDDGYSPLDSLSHLKITNDKLTNFKLIILEKDLDALKEIDGNPMLLECNIDLAYEFFIIVNLTLWMKKIIIQLLPETITLGKQILTNEEFFLNFVKNKGFSFDQSVFPLLNTNSYETLMEYKRNSEMYLKKIILFYSNLKKFKSLQFFSQNLNLQHFSELLNEFDNEIHFFLTLDNQIDDPKFEKYKFKQKEQTGLELSDSKEENQILNQNIHPELPEEQKTLNLENLKELEQQSKKIDGKQEEMENQIEIDNQSKEENQDEKAENQKPTEIEEKIQNNEMNDQLPKDKEDLKTTHSSEESVKNFKDKTSKVQKPMSSKNSSKIVLEKHETEIEKVLDSFVHYMHDLNTGSLQSLQKELSQIVKKEKSLKIQKIAKTEKEEKDPQKTEIKDTITDSTENFLKELKDDYSKEENLKKKVENSDLVENDKKQHESSHSKETSKSKSKEPVQQLDHGNDQDEDKQIKEILASNELGQIRSSEENEIKQEQKSESKNEQTDKTDQKSNKDSSTTQSENPNDIVLDQIRSDSEENTHSKTEETKIETKKDSEEISKDLNKTVQPPQDYNLDNPIKLIPVSMEEDEHFKAIASQTKTTDENTSLIQNNTNIQSRHKDIDLNPSDPPTSSEEQENQITHIDELQLNSIHENTDFPHTLSKSKAYDIRNNKLDNSHLIMHQTTFNQPSVNTIKTVAPNMIFSKYKEKDLGLMLNKEEQKIKNLEKNLKEPNKELVTQTELIEIQNNNLSLKKLLEELLETIKLEQEILDEENMDESVKTQQIGQLTERERNMLKDVKEMIVKIEQNKSELNLTQNKDLAEIERIRSHNEDILSLLEKENQLRDINMNLFENLDNCQFSKTDDNLSKIQDEEIRSKILKENQDLLKLKQEIENSSNLSYQDNSMKLKEIQDENEKLIKSLQMKTEEKERLKDHEQKHHDISESEEIHKELKHLEKTVKKMRNDVDDVKTEVKYDHQEDKILMESIFKRENEKMNEIHGDEQSLWTDLAEKLENEQKAIKSDEKENMKELEENLDKLIEDQLELLFKKIFEEDDHNKKVMENQVAIEIGEVKNKQKQEEKLNSEIFEKIQDLEKNQNQNNKNLLSEIQKDFENSKKTEENRIKVVEHDLVSEIKKDESEHEAEDKSINHELDFLRSEILGDITSDDKTNQRKFGSIDFIKVAPESSMALMSKEPNFSFMKTKLRNPESFKKTQYKNGKNSDESVQAKDSKLEHQMDVNSSKIVINKNHPEISFSKSQFKPKSEEEQQNPLYDDNVDVTYNSDIDDQLRDINEDYPDPSLKFGFNQQKDPKKSREDLTLQNFKNVLFNHHPDFHQLKDIDEESDESDDNDNDHNQFILAKPKDFRKIVKNLKN